MDSLLVSNKHPFVGKWRGAFAGIGANGAKCTIDPDIWERSSAIKELKRTNWLDFVRPADELMDLASIMLFRYIVREVEVYDEVSNDDVRRNRELRDVLHVLNRTQKRLLNARNTTTLQDLKNVLTRLSQIISAEQATIQRHHESYWDQALLATRAARDKWLIDIEELRAVPPEELLDGEKIFANMSFPKKLTRRTDLDKRFQIRTAAILRRCLPDTSLETLSRLVVLCYLCGSLVTIVDGNAYLRPDSPNTQTRVDRVLTVGAVYQKLKDEPALRPLRGQEARSSGNRVKGS